MSRISWRFLAAASVFFMAGVAWHVAWGQTKKREPDKPAETFLPSDAIAYFRHDGSAAHRKEWEQTAAYHSLVKSGFWKSAEEWVTALGRQRPDAEKLVAQLLPLFRQATVDGVSAAVRLVKSGETFEPQLTVVLHRGAAKEADVFKLLKQADPNAQESSLQGRKVLRGQLPGESQEWGCWSDSGQLVLVLGRDAISAVLQRTTGKTVPDVRGANLWRKNNGVPKDVTLMAVAWVDLEQLTKLVRNIPLPPEPDVPSPPNVGEVLDIWGLGSLQNLVFQSGLQGKACWSQMRLEHAGPRKGVLKLADARPFQLSDLPPLPPTATGFTAVAVNWAGAYDEGWERAREFARKLGHADDMAKAEDEWTRMQDQLGWTVREDLIASLGQLHVLYFDPTGALGGAGVGAAVQVADGEKLRKVVNQLVGTIPQNAPNTPEVVRQQKQGHEVISLNFGRAGVPVPVFPSLCVTDDWLILAATPQMVESFLLRKAGQLPAWKPDDELAKSLKELPQSMQAISVNDPRAMVLGLGQAAPLILAGVAGQIPGGLPRELMAVSFPPAEVIAQPLFANVSVTTTEGAQIAVTGKNSLPFLTGGDASSVAVAAVGVALLLPAVQQAREAARRTQSRNNLKQIGLALHNFHDAFNKFPTGTLPGPGQPDDRLSWQAAILPYIDQAALYKQIDRMQGWQAGANQLPSQTRIQVFVNPGLTLPQLPGGKQHTDYVGIAGLGPDGPKLKLNDKGAGVFAYDRATGIRDITDGTSNTIMVGEASKDRGPWIQGGKATIRPFTQKPYINGPDGFGGGWRGGSHFLYADGSVRFISENVDPAIIEAVTTIRGGELVNVP